MSRFLVVLIALFCATLPTLALANDWPTWVRGTDLLVNEDSITDFVDDGVHSMLFDVQVRLNPDGYDRFSRRVVKVVSRAGLETVGAAQFDYDPASEELIVHDVWRDRNGVRSKVTDLVFIDVRRETEMDFGILDGRLTRYADINDLRVGDVIDISWTVQVKPTVFPEHFQYWRTEKPYYSFQVDQFRLLSPQARAIAINGPATPVVSTIDDWDEYVWRHENTPNLDRDDSNKTWAAFYGETQITTASNWSTIVAPIVDAYASRSLPAELEKIVDGIEGTEAERVTAAFRLVQEQIRYMGIEIGAGGYIPRLPEMVWSRRFGDCKDKALLLTSILDHMEIAADVVLVNLNDGDFLADYLPSPYVFNHAIVRVHGLNGQYFLDPTDVLQGGVGDAVWTSDFRWALPVTAQSEGLVAVPQQKMEDPNYEVLSRYEFKEDGDLGAELYVETTYKGDSADWQRYRLSRSGTDDRADRLFEWYDKRYPGVQILTPLRAEDDLDANSVVIYEHYGITEEGLEKHRNAFWMNPYATKGELDELPDEGLDAPFPIDPLFHRHRVELVGLPGLEVPPKILMNNPFFRYTRNGFEIDDGVAAVFEVETLVTEVQPVEAEAYAAAVEAQDNQDDRKFRLANSNRILAKPLAIGITTRSAIPIGSFLFVLCLLLLAAWRGYVAERQAWIQKSNECS